MADAIADTGCDLLDAEVITLPDSLEKRDASGCDPQAGIAQLLGGGRSLGSGHGRKPTSITLIVPENE